MASAFNKFQPFIAAVHNKVHNLATDQLMIALCASANPPVATNSVLADLTTAATTNLDTVTLTTATSAHTTGTYKLDFNDLTMTATGSVGPFRYVVIYDDTPSSPADPLVCWFDYGIEITMLTGETLQLVFDAAGLFTVA